MSEGIKEVTLENLLESGAHFGHRTSSSHPKMAPFIFGQRQGIHILDLAKTKEYLEAAYYFVRETVSNGGVIIFVGSKPQASRIIESYAKEAGMPYVNKRWLGGTLTNFKVISSLIQKYKKLKEDKQSGELEKYTKKEQMEIGKEIERLEELAGGLENLTALPQGLFIVDVREEKTALREAMRLNIPVVAVVDTNVNPTGVAYPIPANDDGTKSIDLMVKLIKDAVIEGRANIKEDV